MILGRHASMRVVGAAGQRFSKRRSAAVQGLQTPVHTAAATVTSQIFTVLTFTAAPHSSGGWRYRCHKITLVHTLSEAQSKFFAVAAGLFHSSLISDSALPSKKEPGSQIGATQRPDGCHGHSRMTPACASGRREGGRGRMHLT